MKTNDMKARKLIAVIVNLILFAGMLLFLASGAQSVLLFILLPTLFGIALCGSLLYFLYYVPKEEKSAITWEANDTFYAVSAIRH